MSERKTIDQQRAADALDKIRTMEKECGDEQMKRKYRSYIDGLPATIVMNGLGQACAMLLSNAEGESGEDNAHRRLYDHLEKWLCRDSDLAPYGESDGLLKGITQGDQDDYVRAQTEALAWLNWAKKFSRAYLPKPEGGSDNG